MIYYHCPRLVFGSKKINKKSTFNLTNPQPANGLGNVHMNLKSQSNVIYALKPCHLQRNGQADRRGEFSILPNQLRWAGKIILGMYCVFICNVVEVIWELWLRHSRLIPICNAFFYSTWPPSFSSHVNTRGERRWPQNKTGFIHRYQATVDWEITFLTGHTTL